LAALLVLAGVAAYVLRKAAENGPAPPPAEFFLLSLPDADGNVHPLSGLRGKALVVNFWATWCVPCVAELPELDKLQAEFAERGVEIVGIATESPERVRLFRDERHLRLTLLAGGYDSLSIARNLGDLQGVLPYTAVFSVDGRLLHTKVGALEPGQLRTWLLADADANRFGS